MTVTLQLGQYGNQIGPAFFQKILKYASKTGDDVSEYFRYSEKLQRLIPRALLIDMEPKVVEKCLQSQLPQYLENQAVVRQSGAGNNWAHGYAHFGPLVIEDVLDRLRHELDELDRPAAVNVFSSLAGGTGSGLSSYILEKLKDELPDLNITSHCVLPFMNGEVNTQSYNAVLSLSAIFQHADAVAMTANDDARGIYQKSFPSQTAPSFSQLNSVISQQIALNTMLKRLEATSPSYKCVSLRSVPSAEVADNRRNFAVVSVAKQMVLTGAVSDSQLNYQETKGAVKYVEGEIQMFVNQQMDTEKYLGELQNLRKVCENRAIFTMKSCNITSKDTGPLGNCAGLALNGMTLGKELQQVKDDLIDKLSRGQFLHLYEKYGVERADVERAIGDLLQVEENYGGL